MTEYQFPRKYAQRPGSRQGEIIAWMLFIFLALVTVFLSSRTGLNTWYLIFDLFFLLSAILVSFGNYVNRSTRMVLTEDNIKFFNGIRKIQMAWEQIDEVLEVPSRMGPKIWIIGNGKRIAFQKNSVIKWKEEIRDRIGFEESDEIMDIIMKKRPNLELRKEEYYYPDD